MLSVSYAGKNTYSEDKTGGLLRGGASRANRCYVLVHCAPPQACISKDNLRTSISIHERVIRIMDLHVFLVKSVAVYRVKTSENISKAAAVLYTVLACHVVLTLV